METTQEIYDRFYARLCLELQKVDTSFDSTVKNDAMALSMALAPEIRLLNLGLDEIVKQMTPLTADSSTVSPIGMLEVWGELLLQRRPLPAQQGEYEITITGEFGGYFGGTQYVHNITGEVYLLKSNLAVVDGVGTGTVVAASGGMVAALKAGDELAAQTVVNGLDETATVVVATKEPVEAEGLEQYRKEVVSAFSVVPHGGNSADIVAWAAAVPGVEKVYPYAGGSIDDEEGRLGGSYVYVKADTGDGYPTQLLLNAVKDELDKRASLDAAYMRIVPIVPLDITVDIIGLQLKNPVKEVAVKQIIEATIVSYFSGLEPFIDAIDREGERNDTVEKGKLFAKVQEAIVEDGSLYDCSLTDVYGAPIVLRKLVGGEIPMLKKMLYGGV